MSTIASPREPSLSGRRDRIPLIATPTSSSRPSLDLPIRSTSNSPVPSSSTTVPGLPKRNRAALREYYNLRKPIEDPSIADTASEVSSIPDAELNLSSSDVLPSELDHASFVPERYVQHVLETQSLAQLLRTYNGILTDIRALDAEKKALVYDNYSKLIVATETIGKMRRGMDPLDPVARTLGPAIGELYARAEEIRGEVRRGVEDMDLKGGGDEGEREKERQKERRRVVVRDILGTPERVRGLVEKGDIEEARKMWGDAKMVLERWREREVGGKDVDVLLEKGERAINSEVDEQDT